MAGIVKLSEVQFDEPSGIVPLSAIKFDDDESAWEGFVKPTLKAIPRVVGHTVASMAQMPVSGIAAGAKFISSKGDINAASKVLEDNQQAIDSFYLTNDAERQGAANIGLAMKPFQMAGEGLQEIVKLTPLEGTIAEPIAGTVGEASAMFGLGGAGKAIKARANKSMGALKDVIEPIKTDIVIKPQKIVRLEDVKFDEPKVEPKIVPLESVKIDEVAPEVKAEVKPVEAVATPDVKKQSISEEAMEFADNARKQHIISIAEEFNKKGAAKVVDGRLTYIVHKSTKQPGKIQVSVIDEKGPVRDFESNNLREALDTLTDENISAKAYRRPDLPDTAYMDVFPEGSEYVYEYRSRPMSIGTQPEGFIKGEEGGRHGRVVYDRPLTKDEIYKYELNPIEYREPKTDLPSVETVTQPVEKPVVAEVKGSADLKGNGEYQAPAFPNRTFDIVKGAKGEGWIIKEGYTGLPMPQSSSLKGILKTKQDAIDHIKNNFGLTPEQIKYNIEQGTLSDKSILWNKGKITEQTKKPEEDFKGRVTKAFPGKQSVTLFSGLDPTIAIDIMKTISAKTSEIIEANKMTPSVARGVKAAKDAMIEQDRNVRRAESTAKLFEKIIQDIVPKPERQMEMVHAYEHKMKGKAWDGLTEIEKGAVRWVAEEKAKLNKYIKDNDILETMPESGTINHIFHHWIDKETGKPYKAMYGKFSKGLPQAKQRVIPTYEVGIKNGMTPATTNIGKLIGMEWESVTRANNARQLFKKLHGIKGDDSMSIVRSKGGEPQPIRMVESWSNLEKQGLTDGYVRYDNNFLDKAMTFESSDGRLITMKGAVGVKEELYPFVHAYIDSPQYGKLSELNFASKSLTLGASLFHPVSLGMQELANLRTPFVHIPQGLRIIKELGPEVRLLHQEGLELFKGYEDLGFKNQFFDDGSTLGKTGNVITWPISKMRDFIFDYVQPGMKVSFAHAMFTKMLPKYLEGTKFTAEEVMAMYESGKPLPPEALQCAREVVQKADGHFSGEHYKRSLLETNRFMVKLYFTPEARVKWQAALLSPTWQREHLLVAKNVVKSFMPDKMIKKLGMAELGPIKSQYRRYALGAIMIIGAVDLWNYNASLIMDGEGKHLWQNPTGKGFAARAWWNEPAYTIQDKNGRYKYIPEAPAYIRPLKSVFEVAEWVHDPVLKLGYKLSPVLSALGEQLFGQKKYVGLPDIPKRALDFIVDSTTPIIVDQAIRTAQGKQSIQATALPFIGMPVSRLKQMNYKSNPEGN